MEPALRWRTAWLAAGWLLIAAVVFLSLAPSPPEIGIVQGDKLGHFFGYGTLMFWFCQLYSRLLARAAFAASFAAMGVALEFIQGWLGHRDFEFLDIAANALGVLIGWGIVLVTGARLFGTIEGWYYRS